MNNLKQYKKHFGKEFVGCDEKTDMFYNSRAVTQMFTKLNKMEKENEQLKQRIDKATNLYLKTLAEKKQVDDLACDMFNILEGNVK